MIVYVLVVFTTAGLAKVDLTMIKIFFLSLKACDYSCKECTGGSPTECTSCNDVNNRVFDQGQCSCKTDYIEMPPPNAHKCILCSEYCVTCTGPTKTDCSTCDSGLNRIISSKQCICFDGYYDDGITLTC